MKTQNKTQNKKPGRPKGSKQKKMTEYRFYPSVYSIVEKMRDFLLKELTDPELFEKKSPDQIKELHEIGNQILEIEEFCLKRMKKNISNQLRNQYLKHSNELFHNTENKIYELGLEE